MAKIDKKSGALQHLYVVLCISESDFETNRSEIQSNSEGQPCVTTKEDFRAAEARSEAWQQ